MITRKSLFAAIALALFILPTALHAGYRMELNRATETGKLYRMENMDAGLIWNATFFNDAFRNEYEKRHLKLIHFDDQSERDEFISSQSAQQNKYWEFFVGVYTRDDYKYFSNDDSSFWKIYITTENGERVEPLSIARVNITPYELEMYPYLNRWSRAYRILFPKVDLGKKFKLTASSVIGTSVLSWKNK